VPVHLQPAFAHLGLRPGAFPVTERAAREILSLPMFPGITLQQQERVAEELTKALVA
jgi:dTDP-4-amino-4,6-dideoxygalactose transaminase